MDLLLVFCALISSFIIGFEAAAYVPARRSDKVMFCYYSSYAQTRPKGGAFLPEDIDPFLCTHVIYAFADVIGGTNIRASNWNDEGENGLYKRTTDLKKKNPHLKVLIAVGGWTVGSKPFVKILQSEENKQEFIQNLIRFLRRNNFDGLDMDWEFPASRGSPPRDRYRFTEFLKDIQQAFGRESRDTGREKLLLTLATAGGSYFIGISYEPKEIHKWVDYMLLMAYNYHGSWNNYTGHHSGLYARNDEIGKQRELNQKWTVDFWKSQGVPGSKLVLGMATYAMTFTLGDYHQHGLGAPASGGGAKGEFTGEKGILSYYEVCKRIDEGWSYVWIEDQKVPYIYRGKQWAGFDDKNSFTSKANFILDNDLAGAFIWSVEMDDFAGKCGKGKYPLLSTVKNIIRPYGVSFSSKRVTPRKAMTSPRPAYTSEEYDDDDDRPSHVVRASRRRHSDDDDDVTKPPRRWLKLRKPTKPARRIRLTSQGHYTDYPDVTDVTKTSSKTVKPTPVVIVNDSEIECPSPGIHRSPGHCNSYFVCIMAAHQWKVYRMKCPTGLGFDDVTKACVYDTDC